MRETFSVKPKSGIVKPQPEPVRPDGAHPPPTLRPGWRLTPPDDSGKWFAVAYCVGPADGWDLFWSDDREDPCNGTRGGEIDWPFGDDDWANRRDFEAIGFVYES